MERRNEQWRIELRNAMKAKERTGIARVRMPELEPSLRSTCMAEVNLGLSPEAARAEARRCLDCARPGCVEGCPVEIDIPTFIKNIERGEFIEAARTLKESSALPAVCGRVCPQEKQCEARCIHLKAGKEPVAIGHLERFAADRDAGAAIQTAPANGIRVAAIGSGPAGLSFAGEMARTGYSVTVFEALHETGGVLRYGIPVFRLPNETVDAEIDSLKAAGVQFVTNCIVGKTVTPDELLAEGFAGIFAGSGAGLPRFMNIRGENLAGVMSSNEYLTRVNLMDAASPDTDTPVIRGRNVVVVGGGNTAMDAVRTARRLGAERAMLVYRRSEDEMPARLEEIHHAKEEGIEFMTLRNPVEYRGDERGRVVSVLLQVMELGAPDASGRRQPVEVAGKTELLETDQVIVSVGVSPNPLVPQSVEGLDISPRGTIRINESTMQTSVPEIFAGGDIVRGGATVILAMGDGRRAARAMNERLKNGPEAKPQTPNLKPQTPTS
jgi:glutamate synthase (NADPH/NADH) small chain